MQKQRPGIIRRLERLLEQQERLHRTRFSRAICARENRQRTNLDVALLDQGLVAARTEIPVIPSAESCCVAVDLDPREFLPFLLRFLGEGTFVPLMHCALGSDHEP